MVDQTYRLIVEIVHAAVEVGGLAHQRRHVPRGGHVEEGPPVDVRRLDHIATASSAAVILVRNRHLVVADAVIVQHWVGVVVLEGVFVVLLLLLWRLRFMVDCVLLVLGSLY